MPKRAAPTAMLSGSVSEQAKCRAERESRPRFDVGGGHVDEREGVDHAAHGTQRSTESFGVVLAPPSGAVRDREMRDERGVLTQMRAERAGIQLVVQQRD